MYKNCTYIVYVCLTILSGNVLCVIVCLTILSDHKVHTGHYTDRPWTETLSLTLVGSGHGTVTDHTVWSFIETLTDIEVPASPPPPKKKCNSYYLYSFSFPLFFLSLSHINNRVHLWTTFVFSFCRIPPGNITIYSIYLFTYLLSWIVSSKNSTASFPSLF